MYSIPLNQFYWFYMLGTVLDTGDGETIKTDIDPDLRELLSLIHSVSTCCLLSLIY